MWLRKTLALCHLRILTAAYCQPYILDWEKGWFCWSSFGVFSEDKVKENSGPLVRSGLPVAGRFWKLPFLSSCHSLDT